MSKLKVFEGFAGIGSQRRALEKLGIEYEVVGISEWNINASIVYNEIHEEEYKGNVPETKDDLLKVLSKYTWSSDGKKPLSQEQLKKRRLPELQRLYVAQKNTNNYGSIVDLRIEDIPSHNLFTYSFPCQDITIAGSKEGLDLNSGTRSSLVWDSLKIVEYHKPEYLLMENVKNLVGKQFIGSFNKLLAKLDELGYNNYWQVLNAKNYGIPQGRERVFCVSIRKDIDKGDFKFPEPQELTRSVKDFMETSVDAKYIFTKEKVKTIEQSNKEIKEESIDKLNIVGMLDVTDLDCQRRVYTERGMCATITTHTLNNILIYGKCDNGYTFKLNNEEVFIRKLTPRETYKLMGFTDLDYEKAVKVASNTQLYKQAGNSIVVDVLEAIFRELF